MLAGMAIGSIGVARRAERIGRRRLYVALLIVMAAAGSVFAFTRWLPALIAAALTGTLSTDPNESGPITSIEQAMIGEAAAERRARVFGRYNAIAFLTGAVGALAAGGPAALRDLVPRLPADQRWLLVFAVVGSAAALMATRLSSGVEAADQGVDGLPPLGESRQMVMRLSALFSLDSFGGGFVVQSFLVFWFVRRFGTTPEVMGVVFFVVGLLQAGSSIAAGRLAPRIGLINTMVFTHLPSNILLAAVPLAPNLTVAVILLILRFAMSQMDVPARQAYVVSVVAPRERSAASAYTNLARYVTRPAGPVVGGVLMQNVALGAPFVAAGALKAIYDLLLFASFRKVRPDGFGRTAAGGPQEQDGETRDQA